MTPENQIPPDPRFATGREAMLEQSQQQNGNGATAVREGGPILSPEQANSGIGAAGAYRDIFDQIAPPMRLVMCPPRYLSTRVPNNVFMERDKEEVDIPRALRQFQRSVNVLNALDVETLFIPPVPEAQDQTYTANIAVAIKPFIILANYKAEGREPEIEPARKFFESMGYKCVQPPYHFEGEADLKKITEGVYVGGYGEFTDIRAHQWIEELTGVQIVPVHEVDEELYHLDCSLLIVDEQHALVTKEGLDPNSLKALEHVLDITITPRGKGLVHTGITNAVLVPDKKIYLSGTFNPELPEYRQAMEWLNQTMDGFGYTCVFLDVDEYDKSGADLSCSVMHLTFEPEEVSTNDGQSSPANPPNVAGGPAPSAAGSQTQQPAPA